MSRYENQQNNIAYQRQSQEYQHKASQINSEEQIVKYTVRQDFLNVLTIAADFQGGLNQQGNEKNLDQIITMLHNKLILQVNLSSSIHQDQFQQCQKSPQLSKTLREEKNKVKEILNSILQEKKFDPQIEKYLISYLKNCLIDYPNPLNDPLNPVQHKAAFNQETIQKVFCSVNQTDQKYRDIQSGKEQVKDLYQSDIDKHIKERINAAQRKLQSSQESRWKCSCQLI